VKVSKDYQDIKYTKLNKEKGEAGLLVEYFIRYNKKSLLPELRSNYKLGNIIKNVKLFTGKNFKELANEIKKNTNENIILNTNISFGCLNMNEVKIIPKINETNVEKDIKEESLEYYEKKYLFKGKYFVYPYSIPFVYIPYEDLGKKKSESSEGRIRYLMKYQNAILEGEKYHYGKDYNFK
jgi:hypothetical protein